MAAGFRNKQRILRRMAEIPAAARGEMRVAMSQNRLELVAALVAAAPVDDGDLRASVRSEDQSDDAKLRFEVTVGDERAYYAKMVEHGTPKMGAQPFFYPTIRYLKRKFASRLSRAARKGAKRVLKA